MTNRNHFALHPTEDINKERKSCQVVLLSKVRMTNQANHKKYNPIFILSKQHELDLPLPPRKKKKSLFGGLIFQLLYLDNCLEFRINRQVSLWLIHLSSIKPILQYFIFCVGFPKQLKNGYYEQTFEKIGNFSSSC